MAIKLTYLLEEKERDKKNDKKVSKDFVAMKLFEKSNKGSIKKSGIIKLARQIKKNQLRYNGYPEWVLRRWLDPTQFPVIPLSDNRWFDVKSIITSDSDLDIKNVVYGGWIVDALRNEEFGVKTISLNTDSDIDYRKYNALLIFKKAAIQALKIIDTIEDKNNRDNQQANDETNNINMGGATESNSDNDFIDLQ